MEKLVQGIHKFHQQVFTTQRELFERLTQGQSPDALFITCSDSRIDPGLLTQTDPGDLFVLRNAGNIIPPYGAGDGGGEAATLEFAVAGLGVKDIIVCGHTHCGAMAALLDPSKTENLPDLRRWLRNAESTRRIVAENYAHLEDPATRVKATVQENVLVQLENLRTHPAVAARIARGQLNLHAWVYKLEEGRVFTYDPGDGQYVPLRPTPRTERLKRARMLEVSI